MSFMFNPLPYDDPYAINHIKLKEATINGVVKGTEEIAIALLEDLVKKNHSSLLLDGYISASFDDLMEALKAVAEEKGLGFHALSMTELYKSEEEINTMTAQSLPLNYEDDPVLLFGKIYRGVMDDFIDPEKLSKTEELLKQDGIKVIYGQGSSAKILRDKGESIAYVDITPKVCTIRSRNAEYKNIGDQESRPFRALMRRNYYVDYEVTVKNRRELLLNDLIDYYIMGSDPTCFYMVDQDGFNDIMETLVEYPFRAKPVYLEGIWGGEFIRKVRKIPMEAASNLAWIFDFIPMEVSVVVDVNGEKLDIPFQTFMHKEGLKLMGEKAYREFDGYFPIRFNYDDTYHSNGNMSIQCHPYEDFVIENYDEFGRQDEGYYVVATGHGARTYLGFKGDGREFLELAKESEVNHRDIDYKQYINSVQSIPGRQVMLPAGTIHASGRNQVVLETGSLTIGSYTYKVFDYNRREKDGTLRPIHTKNAEKVLHFERDSQWVDENVAIEPILLDEKEGYAEYIVGKTDLMYYETHRIEMNQGVSYEGTNNNQFTVFSVVDGEEVKVYSKSNPDFCYTANFLDIIVIPATITDYVIEAKGYQPVVIYKVILRDGYSRYLDQKYWSR